MSKLTEQEAYRVLAKASGIKKGDKVKVLRKWRRNEYGCDVHWNRHEKRDTIGKIGKVDCITEEGHVSALVGDSGTY